MTDSTCGKVFFLFYRKKRLEKKRVSFFSSVCLDLDLFPRETRKKMKRKKQNTHPSLPLELPDVLPQLLQLLLLRSRDHVVCPLSLVGGDEVSIVSAGQGNQRRHHFDQLLLQLPVDHLRALHRVCQVQAGDVPAP